MLVQQLGTIFSSTIWVRYFIIALMTIYYLDIRRKSEAKEFRFFPIIMLLILARELVFTFLRFEEVIIVFETAIIALYLVWLRKYTTRVKLDFVFFGFAILCSVWLILNNSGANPGPNFMNSQYLVPIICFSYLAINMFQVSQHNTAHADLIMKMRKIFVIFYFISLILFMIFGHFNPFVFTFLYPLYFFSHFYFIYQYQKLYDFRTNKKVRYLTNDLDSVFYFMEKIGTAITERLEMSEVLQFVADSATRNLNADAGAILMIDEYDDVLQVKAVNGIFPPPYHIGQMVKRKTESVKHYFENTPIKLGDTILGEAAKEGLPIYVRDTKEDERMKHNTREDICFVSSIIVIPLLVKKKILGVLAVIRSKPKKFFSENDFTHLKTFAEYASLTIDNLLTYMEILEKQEMEREVGIAADIQLQLLPSKLPKIKGTQFSAFSVPAKGVSGDYYDVIPIKKGKVALVICDVAGKGVPASLVMVMIRTIIHLIAGADKDARTIMTWINRGVAGKISIDRFATMSFLTYDPKTGEIEYANAAHHPLFIFKAKTKTIESLDAEGLPIGLDRNTNYGQNTIKLEKDDCILLYTDGIIEAMNPDGDQYTYERLEEVVKKHYALDAEALIEEIKKDIWKFVRNARQHDDLTLLCMKSI
ncbi:MAG: PP2C family protein-serine/threonine phosphatase [Spirochaetia bacterium]